VQQPSEYAGSSILNVACTQTGLSRARQERLIDEWCNLLPELPVRTLVLSSKVPQRLFDAACGMPRLQALNLKWSSVSSLAPISQAKSLRALFIGSSPSIECLAALSDLAEIEHLFIENVQQPVDLSFVSALTKLREFGLSSSRGSKLQVQTLEPLATLEQLEMLWLVGLQVLHGGLYPLHRLRHLASLRTTVRKTSKEYLELCSAVPTLQHFQPVG
jgi:hypothetical protein